MLAAVTRSPGEIVIEDVSGPGRARAGYVIVRPEAVGICGSDFHLFSGDVGALSGARDFYPRVQGHEVSAVVEDAGDARGVREGDRVAIWPLLPCGRCYPCRTSRPNVCIRFRLVGVHVDGGLAERLEVPAGLVFAVGDLDPDCASFVEPASVAVHALARGRLAPGEQVVVFGAGPIGLATLVAAVHQGARVLSVDPLAGRRELAKRLGAEVVTWAPGPELTDQVHDWTKSEGPPLVIETSGEAAVLPQATELVAAAGRVVVVGMSSGTAPVRPGAFPEKEIDVIGSSCATAGDFREAIKLIAANRAAVAALFSHHRPRRARRHHPHLPGHLVAGRGADRPAALDHGHVRCRDRDRPAARPADPDYLAHQLSRHDPVRARRRGAAGSVAAPGHVAIARGGLVVQATPVQQDTSRRQKSRRPDRRQLTRAGVTAVLLLFVLFGLPQLMSLYYIDTMTQVAVYSMVAVGLGLLVGRVGLVSLGQVAVLAIGAWVAARLLFATTQPYPLVLLEAGLITMVAGLLIGLPALRLRGLYLALITLILAGAITVVLATANFPNGGHGFLGYNGSLVHIPPIRRPSIASSDPAYFRYSVVVAILMFALVLAHIKTRPGRAWAAIRQSEPAALAAGINTWLYKLWVFALASFITGVAGGVLAGAVHYLYSIGFPNQDSITLLAAPLRRRAPRRC